MEWDTVSKQLLLDNLPTFNGCGQNVQNNLESFLSIGRGFVNQFPSHENEILFFLQLKIKGEAACHIKYADIKSFFELEASLINEYISIDAISNAYESIFQNISESVKEYGSRFSKCFRDYIKYLNLLNSPRIEQRAKRKFRNGLRSIGLQNKALQWEVIEKYSLPKFIEMVVSLDLILEDSQNYPKIYNSSVVVEQKTNEPPNPNRLHIQHAVNGILTAVFDVANELVYKQNDLVQCVTTVELNNCSEKHSTTSPLLHSTNILQTDHSAYHKISSFKVSSENLEKKAVLSVVKENPTAKLCEPASIHYPSEVHTTDKNKLVDELKDESLKPTLIFNCYKTNDSVKRKDYSERLMEVNENQVLKSPNSISNKPLTGEILRSIEQKGTEPIGFKRNKKLGNLVKLNIERSPKNGLYLIEILVSIAFLCYLVCEIHFRELLILSFRNIIKGKIKENFVISSIFSAFPNFSNHFHKKVLVISYNRNERLGVG